MTVTQTFDAHARAGMFGGMAAAQTTEPQGTPGNRGRQRQSDLPEVMKVFRGIVRNTAQVAFFLAVNLCFW